MSAGSKQVRRHNRERGTYPLTAGPSGGPGVRRFWPPRTRHRFEKEGQESQVKSLVFSLRKIKGGGSPMCS